MLETEFALQAALCILFCLGGMRYHLLSPEDREELLDGTRPRRKKHDYRIALFGGSQPQSCRYFNPKVILIFLNSSVRDMQHTKFGGGGAKVRNALFFLLFCYSSILSILQKLLHLHYPLATILAESPNKKNCWHTSINSRCQLQYTVCFCICNLS